MIWGIVSSENGAAYGPTNWGKKWPQRWEKLRQLIITSRRIGNDMDIRTSEDVLIDMKLMNSGTAVGIDQWSPHHWKQLSPEALEAITHLFKHIEQHGVWPGHIYIFIYILHYNCPHGQTSWRIQARCPGTHAI